MPNVSHKPPSRIVKAGKYLLLLVENVVPMNSRLAVRFRYVLVVCDRRNSRPVCFVTLENSPSISNVLCVFEVNGSHWNYGALTGSDLLAEFMDKAMLLVRRRFALGEIEEVSRQPPSRRSRWKFLPRAARKRGGQPASPASVRASSGARAPTFRSQGDGSAFRPVKVAPRSTSTPIARSGMLPGFTIVVNLVCPDLPKVLQRGWNYWRE